MNIGPERFQAIAAPILGSDVALARREAIAICQLLDLVASSDLDATSSERVLRDQIGRQVCALAGVDYESVAPCSPIPLPIDAEARRATLVDLARRLERRPVRELAYVLAYLVAVEDLAILEIEDALIVELRRMLAIDIGRADALVIRAVEQATPLERAGS